MCGVSRAREPPSPACLVSVFVFLSADGMSAIRTILKELSSSLICCASMGSLCTAYIVEKNCLRRRARDVLGGVKVLGSGLCRITV